MQETQPENIVVKYGVFDLKNKNEIRDSSLFFDDSMSNRLNFASDPSSALKSQQIPHI